MVGLILEGLGGFGRGIIGSGGIGGFWGKGGVLDGFIKD